MGDDQYPEDMPHILWVYTDHPSEELSSVTWLETTKELRRLGWNVTLVAVGPEGDQCIRGIRLSCIPKPDTYILGLLVFHIRLLRMLSRIWSSIDVILFHQLSAAIILPLQLVRILDRRKRPLLVMDSRTLPMVPEERETPKDLLYSSIHDLSQRLANRWADGQTAITERLARAVRIPPQQMWGIWPSGVDSDLFKPAQRMRRWPEEGEQIRLVYTGILSSVRNLMQLCRAVARANAEGMDIALSLVGDGPDREPLEQAAQQTRARIEVIGPFRHEEIADLLARYHIGVLPFPDEEKFRVSSFIKLFEYMASGLPILATRIVAHTDVVGNGSYAFWAEDASEEGLLEAIREIWDSRDTLSARGSEAAKAGQGWTWGESAKKLAKALSLGMSMERSDKQN